MAGGNWKPSISPGRPGLYLNFVEAAGSVIKPGALGTVAMPYTKDMGGSAAIGNFYVVDSSAQAEELFGAGNITAILYVLQGGAREVLVYVMTPSAEEEDYQKTFAAFDTRDFSVFVFDSLVDESIQDGALAWMLKSRNEGKYFMTVFGCSDMADDMTPENGIARCTRLKDDFAVNLITGFVDGLTIKNSAQAAPFIAGMIASCPLNASITYAESPFQDVNIRLTNQQIKDALKQGALVLMNDGEKVKVERGLCTSGRKIRRARVQMAIVASITRTAADSFIGKMINSEDGQIALMSAIKTYFEVLAADGVIAGDGIIVKLSELYPSVGDQVYLDLAFRDLDSMEEICLTVQVG